MTQIENAEIQAAIDWSENGADLNGNINNAPRLLRSAVYDALGVMLRIALLEIFPSTDIRQGRKDMNCTDDNYLDLRDTDDLLNSDHYILRPIVEIHQISTGQDFVLEDLSDTVKQGIERLDELIGMDTVRLIEDLSERLDTIKETIHERESNP